MSIPFPTPRVLIGPRSLDDKICRLMYVRETDEVWAEEWSQQAWVRARVLVRHLLKAPVATRARLRLSGVPEEQGEWDSDPIRA